jgi:diguanylate cyclase (GGDEF)-like protein
MNQRHIAIYAVGISIAALLLAAASQSPWLRTGVATAVILAVFLVMLLLAVLFSQTSAICLGLLAATAAGMSHYSAFMGGDRRMVPAVVFAASVYLPMFSVFLSVTPESPPISRVGAFRMLLALSFLPVCILVYAIVSLAEPPNGLETVIFHEVASWLPVPLPGFLACTGAIAYLAMGSHETPERSHWFTAFLAVACAALMFRSSLWSGAAQPGMLVWTTLGALLVLVGATLDAGWRHANMDELTQLPTRRPLHNHMLRLEAPFVIAVVDVDHFKSVNDRFGHATGDQVLRFIAARLRETQAPGAESYRYGGEEFVVVLPQHDPSTALPVLEDLRRRIADRPFVLRGADRSPTGRATEPPTAESLKGRSVQITVSIGFASAGGSIETPADVLIAADNALYQAKQEGRNRVVERA